MNSTTTNDTIKPKEVFNAVKEQNNFMIRLVLCNQIEISNNIILLCLYLNDVENLKIISNFLISKRIAFNLKFQELNYIVKIDNTNLIKMYKYFINSDIACCVLSSAISNNYGTCCLKEMLKLKIIHKSQNLYALIKHTFNIDNNHNILNILLKYSKKKMVKYAISEKNNLLLDKLLSHLVLKVPFNMLNEFLCKNMILCKDNDKCIRILKNYEITKFKNLRI